MDSAAASPDPQGTNGLWWEVEGSFNNSQCVYQLLIDPETNTVLHFLYKGGCK